MEPAGAFVDGRAFAGLRLLVYGNDEVYAVHLRTADVVRPWQSYRAHFQAFSRWCEIRLPFAQFAPHRLAAQLDLRRLKRIGVVAIGRRFHADIRVAEIAFYR